MLAVAVGAVVVVLDRATSSAPVKARCAAESAGTAWYLSPVQADNAALIALTSVRRGLPARAATIGLATALQESKLLNLDHGDRDSLGLFQQRPSQGWGTVAQLQDPVYATNAFYDVLVTVPGYEALDVTDAAQKVQRSGYPEAYAQHEGRARAWASALTGHSPSSITCRLPKPTAAGSAAAFTDRVRRDLGDLAVSAGDASGDHTVTLTVTTWPGTAPEAVTRLDWALGQWAVAVADSQQVVGVTVADTTWSRSTGTWKAAKAPVAAGQVQVTVAVS